MPIPEEWKNVEYRRAAMEATVENTVAWQVRINREERGLKQVELAKLMATGQSAISKLEDTSGHDVLLSTLFKAAHAFDCALVVRFVEYSAFVAQTTDVTPERMFAAGFASLVETPTLPTAPRSARKHRIKNDHLQRQGASV